VKKRVGEVCKRKGNERRGAGEDVGQEGLRGEGRGKEERKGRIGGLLGKRCGEGKEGKE